MKPEEKIAQKEYDFMAEEYHNMRTKKNPQGWFFNEMLEMPAMLNLLENVKGKKILDLGCGTGIYAKILTKKGAIVKGFDISPAMIKIAKIANPNLDLKVGSAYKIPFNEKFDIVLASLVVHYLDDWNKMFKEVTRVLKSGGYFIFSTGNPVYETRERLKIGDKVHHLFGNYFKERKIWNSWKVNDTELKVFAYHKTYETIIKTLLKNNFEIIDYKDAFPLKKAKKYFPWFYKEYSKKPFFSIWKVRKK